MNLNRVSKTLKKFCANKYEPRPLVLPFWDQVYWFSLAWSVLIASILVKLGTNLSSPANWNSTICVREEPLGYNPKTRLFYVDYPPDLPRLQLPSEISTEYITTHHAIIPDLCGKHPWDANFIHDELSQTQLWEQRLYDHIITDSVLDPTQTIVKPLDIVVIIPGNHEHCFGELPLARMLNPELVVIFASKVIDEVKLLEIIGLLRAETTDQPVAPTASHDDIFSRSAKILRHLGIIKSHASTCHSQSTIINEMINPKHTFADLLTPSFKLVLFGPILAATGVSITSRFRLMITHVKQMIRQKLFNIKYLIFKKPHTD